MINLSDGLSNTIHSVVRNTIASNLSYQYNHHASQPIIFQHQTSAQIGGYQYYASASQPMTYQPSYQSQPRNYQTHYNPQASWPMSSCGYHSHQLGSHRLQVSALQPMAYQPQAMHQQWVAQQSRPIAQQSWPGGSSFLSYRPSCSNQGIGSRRDWFHNKQLINH